MEKKAIMNMKKIRITTKYSEYPVFIGKSILEIFRSHINCYDKILILTDKNIFRVYKDKIDKILDEFSNISIFKLDNSKIDKNIKTVYTLYNYMIENNFTKKSCIITLGGESICEIGGFASATFCGGLDLIEIPTSLIAMINSGTNGIFSIVHPKSKNAICISKYPMVVINDIDFLSSLPKEEILSGLAEAIKCSLMSYKTDNRRFFNYLDKYKEEIFALDSKRIQEVIEDCCRIEKSIIDPKKFDKNQEYYIDFGFEYGSFLENHSIHGNISHGNALSKGIIFQLEIAKLLGSIDELFIKKIIDFFEIFGLDPIPLYIENIEYEKFINKNPEFVVPQHDLSLVKKSIPKEILEKANRSFKSFDYIHEVLKYPNKNEITEEIDTSEEKIYKKAVIDIGTNSVRLFIGLIKEKGNNIELLSELERQVEVVRLGESVNKTQLLNKEAIDRTLKVLTHYKNIADAYGVTEIKAFATSAVRDARNRSEFLNAVRKIPIEIGCISGKEEAKLNFIGNATVFKERILVIDIGGGSTEFSLGENGKLEIVKSIDVGAVRGTEKFFNTGYTEENMINFYHWIKEQLDVLFDIESFKKDDYKIVAVAGTATTQISVRDKMVIYDSQKIHLSKITLHELENNLNLFLDRSRGILDNIIGLSKKREDVIVAGTMILITILKQLVKDVITVSESDNLVGAILEL
ncbi:MAG: iron-containing alcohol dehydrogenase [Fusobacteriaceae bacterium]|jgi:exopolyphosphatase/guanosine-5'-triphosphate,3'-diphosphate pyrophosphatase|nr:iron-containing alcohol dehydrogenase [Fusobacteriaceae bacterium]